MDFIALKMNMISIRKCIVNTDVVSDFTYTRQTPILRIGEQVLTFDVFGPKHLQEVRSTVYIHVQSI